MLDRRGFLVTGSCGLAACVTDGPSGGPEPEAAAEGQRQDELDGILAANAAALPEKGGGANHYPMAAEAWVALGVERPVPTDWVAGARRYGGQPAHAPRRLGDYASLGAWREWFTVELARSSWRSVLQSWVPQLAPGLVGALYHGLIRTAHVARALRQRDNGARRAELAAALAYWAARYCELPGDANVFDTRQPSNVVEGWDPSNVVEGWDPSNVVEGWDPSNVVEGWRPWLDAANDLARLDHADLAADADVPFGEGTAHMVRWADATERGEAGELADVLVDPAFEHPATRLRTVVHAAAVGFLEMLVQQRQRIWLLHGVTAAACAELLLAELDGAGARRLAECTERGVTALWGAFGAPFDPGLSQRDDLPSWPELVRSVAERPSVHGAKLVEALRRCGGGGGGETDRLHRSVAVTFLEWT